LRCCARAAPSKTALDALLAETRRANTLGSLSALSNEALSARVEWYLSAAAAAVRDEGGWPYAGWARDARALEVVLTDRVSQGDARAVFMLEALGKVEQTLLARMAPASSADDSDALTKSEELLSGLHGGGDLAAVESWFNFLDRTTASQVEANNGDEAPAWFPAAAPEDGDGD
jgi:hypothetical protein